MLWLMIIAIFAASSVGFWQAEKAKKKRKAAEKRIGKRLNNQLDFGSFEIALNPGDWDEIRNCVQLSDAIQFELAPGQNEVIVSCGALKIGKAPKSYSKHDLFVEALSEGRLVSGKCVKFDIRDTAKESSLVVSFEAQTD